MDPRARRGSKKRHLGNWESLLALSPLSATPASALRVRLLLAPDKAMPSAVVAPTNRDKKQNRRIKPIDKRARKVHDENTTAAQAPDEGHYTGILAGSRGSIETTIMRHGPSATHPRAHEASGFGVGELSMDFRPSALNCTIPPLGFRRLPTWRAIARPGRLMTRSARVFGAFRGLD